jgi:hypothetical protein
MGEYDRIQCSKSACGCYAVLKMMPACHLSPYGTNLTSQMFRVLWANRGHSRVTNNDPGSCTELLPLTRRAPLDRIWKREQTLSTNGWTTFLWARTMSRTGPQTPTLKPREEASLAPRAMPRPKQHPFKALIIRRALNASRARRAGRKYSLIHSVIARGQSPSSWQWRGPPISAGTSAWSLGAALLPSEVNSPTCTPTSNISCSTEQSMRLTEIGWVILPISVDSSPFRSSLIEFPCFPSLHHDGKPQTLPSCHADSFQRPLTMKSSGMQGGNHTDGHVQGFPNNPAMHPHQGEMECPLSSKFCVIAS